MSSPARPFDPDAADAVTAEDLEARGGYKWAIHPGAIGMGIAEMDVPLPEAVSAVLRSALDAPLLGYIPPAADAAARQACADWYARSTGWAPGADRIHLVSDVLKGLAVTLEHITGPGSTAVVPTPAYMPFLTRPHFVGHPLAAVPSVVDGDGVWRLDLDGLDAALRGGQLLVLCNPWNPVGRVLTRDELLAVSEVVEANGATVYADEIHAPLVYPGSVHVPYASLSPVTANHTVTAVSASKAWNLPALKCAQLIATSDAHQAVFRSLVPYLRQDASLLGVLAGAAAYREGGPWLDDVMRWLEGNRLALSHAVARHLPGARHRPPEGTYLAWIDLRGIEGLPEDLGSFFRRAGVSLQDGAGCGLPGFVRLNIALPRPLLLEAVERMGRAVHAR